MIPPVQFAQRHNPPPSGYSRTPPELAARLLENAEHGISSIPLLHGPREEGKTSAIRHTARLLGAEVRILSFHQGVTPDTVRDTFAKAAKQASADKPIVLALDDVDELGRHPDQSNQLKIEMFRGVDMYRDTPHLFMVATARNIWQINGWLESRFHLLKKVTYRTPVLKELMDWHEIYPLSRAFEKKRERFLN